MSGGASGKGQFSAPAGGFRNGSTPRAGALSIGTGAYAPSVASKYAGDILMKNTVESMSRDRLSLLVGEKGASGWRAAANPELYAADPELMKLAESENAILAQLKVARAPVYALTYDLIHQYIALGLIQSPTDSRLIVKKTFSAAGESGTPTLTTGMVDAVADSSEAFRSNPSDGKIPAQGFAKGDELVFNGYKTTVNAKGHLVFDNFTMSELQGQLNGIQQRYSELHVVETPTISRQSYGRGTSFTTKSTATGPIREKRVWERE